MATLRELIIKISANSRSFQSEISRASRMGQDYYRTMQNGGRQSAAASREMRRALAEVTDQINTAKSSALNMAGAFAGAFATGHLISLADEWNSVNARLKQASQSSDDFQVSQRELMAISQRTGTAFSDNASLFARSAASMREYGYSSEEVLKVTEAISTGLKLSGASTAEASSVITQFSQALAQGVLRGEEFNSVNESGDRVIRALAAGMGVARKDLKAMADNGKLTADKVVPALISQLGALRDEYAAMPDTVSSSATKVENAFMAWVGGANEASGVTKTLSGVLNGLAGNIDTVATAAGALVAVGVARYFGNMASSAGSATAGLITAARNEVALAEAQLRGTQIATARARAAVYRAQQAVVAARGTERQAAAEAKLTAAQASLTRNIAARTAAQTTLNTVTSVGSRLLSGALGLVGGVPGLVMLGATAWYTMYQNQEQARESARQYAATIDEIRQKTSAMSLPEASDNEEKTRQALDEQNRLIDEQKSKIKSLQEKIAGYQYVLANPGWTTDNGFMINHMTSVKTVTEGLAEATNQLAVEQSRLTQMQGKAQSIQDVLAGLEERRVALIRQQAAEQNKAYQSLLIMNGQHTEFNRLLGLGNELLQQRQGLVNVPLRLPQATLDDKQQTALNNSERELALSRLKGEARERARLGYAAYESSLADSNASTRASNDAQLLGYGEGSRMRERLQEMWSIRHEFEQKNNELLRQYQAGEIEEALWKQEKELNKKYLEERLSDQQDYYAKADALRNNWNAGLQEGLTNWADSATDYASQAADAVVSTMDGLVSNISDALAGNVVDWRNWGSSILQEVSKILMNAAIVNGLKSLSGAGGWLGTVGGWISGAVANAKGGVYTSANLSAYSNTIVDTPTYFAFAKGAGLMGEAGPEAIMPLTRAADGSLGVRAIGNVNSGGGFVYSPVYHISIQNQGSNGEIDARSARGLVDLIDSRVVSIMQSSRRDGGLYSA
ncbi:phage tail tape measure protein [Escherichia coli]|uniref:phage tail tape measure protein n=1 Tax=Escherichia coli TaxID=562 RepID=UPI000B5C06CC|nr:phage tail tape measure protein [Escherichia coli]MEA0180815.1 phage tail tape measure protein [Escherichia coli]